MSREFGSFGEFALHLAGLQVAAVSALENGLDKSIALIERDARAEFGEYQGAVGPHPAWPELADSTKENRVSQGYTENDPLLRSGHLRDQTQREREGLVGVVGNTDPVMAYQEFGTSKIPARPVYGPALYKNIDNIQRLAGSAIATGLFGEEEIHPNLGYTQIIP